MRTRAEKTLLQRNAVVTEALFETSVQDSCGSGSRTAHQSRESDISRKRSRVEESFRSHSDHKIGPVVHREYSL